MCASVALAPLAAEVQPPAKAERQGYSTVVFIRFIVAAGRASLLEAIRWAERIQDGRFKVDLVAA